MMKKYCFAIVCLLLCGIYASAQDTKVAFGALEHDFGTINDTDPVSYDFTLTNNSAATLLITDVQASCGCTKPVWTKTPIEPGKKGLVTAIYNPVGRGLGRFTKSIYVKTNIAGTITLKITGNVMQQTQKTNISNPEKSFPTAWGNYLLKTDKIDFGNVSPNDKKSVKIEVYNNGEEALIQRVNKRPSHIAVKLGSSSLQAKTSGEIEFVFDGSLTKSYGIQTGEIALLIDGKIYKIPYKATLLDGATGLVAQKSGKINVNFKEVNFGNFSTGIKRTIRISNSGNATLNIRNIQVKEPFISVSKTQFAIEPDEIDDLTVSIDKKQVKSPLTTTLTITSDDLSSPVTEITLIARP
ncbi:MAG: DUF1573 domain-containing protein [Dysgonamonadaceae bacterium]|jgi:hypothetical protein|nr:DUF1573 domain-containing protein [Dysgonamonadaceae bacterium]